MLPREYYLNPDVLFLSRDLIGKYLMTKIGPTVTGGMITETEAYRAPNDRASHAYNNRRTKRTETMFQEGGICYVYKCYGIHSLFNIVTNGEDFPHAILIRAIQPKIGIEEMLKRRHKTEVSSGLASGPGTLTQALGITTAHNELPLTGPTIWLEDRNVKIENIKTGPRIGVEYAQEDALLPWRFFL
ncbi:MAG: DNA-3-methyladenine glycosylase [Parachlamydiaceae bacterium]|nr:DNA-3-methyladenine glycosylase [Parachlamydiaceae bacterium]